MADKGRLSFMRKKKNNPNLVTRIYKKHFFFYIYIKEIHHYSKVGLQTSFRALRDHKQNFNTSEKKNNNGMEADL